ncbi:uncharacterized protein L969DRAFT_97379 [Mixia osmundae IAM 14324]|uniref:ER-bound oxygenase mpaB/mpaB'/Rubber oxygenase catalytic domain-containing protein n=1 Tax=Mixia osmundae (strain CBS 9802 / IAM 14324 / JCM 22182 / KY 12970) TaxID=764103 RepID=G7DVG7_MIXOS|nr:uncharacterized protein L969DRAFT_97379 [Mixia osmundae IAM 14324]KEI36369.1 hypothetical protein L969DRAFT_97379 [Mixia osmundae IAM 14324]GAA94577.1 hypothetical protein E5Q_01229 [Mixia osmundae IAM 14324]
MSELFFVGDSIRHGETIDGRVLLSGKLNTEERRGKIATRFGYAASADGNEIVFPTLESWRRLSDDLADNVVRYLQLRPGRDGLKIIEEYLSNTPIEQRHPDVTAFWAAVAREPPQDISALPEHQKHIDADYRPSLDASRQPEPTLSAGQAVFWRYSAPLFSSFLHFSLAAGFSSDRLVGVLQQTGYLTHHNRDACFRRLLETTQFILDAMLDMRPASSDGTFPGGQGWRSSVKVRLLHAQVRVKILSGLGKATTYDREADGIPINQEDLCATLGSFAIAPLWVCRKHGMSLTPAEELAYLAAWRHIGFYLGIDQDKLSRHFSSLNSAEKAFASMSFHLFTEPAASRSLETNSTYKILSAVSNRAPDYKPVEYNCEISRTQIGHELADTLGLPRGDWKCKLAARYDRFSMRIFIQFGRYWRPGWDAERVSLFRLVIQCIVAWQLGSRRTHFAMRDPSNYEKELTDTDGSEPTEVVLGAEAGRSIKSRFKWLVAEMAGVFVGIGLLGGFTCYRLYTFATL